MSEQVLEPTLVADAPLGDEESLNQGTGFERLPFSFASMHGVMLEDVAAGVKPKVLHKPGLTLEVLLELQRILGFGFEM